MFVQALNEMCFIKINPNSKTGQMRIARHALMLIVRPESKRSKRIFSIMNRLWDERYPKEDYSWVYKGGGLETITPERMLPDHLDFLLDENSFADMMERKEELDAWRQGDDAYAEWQRLNTKAQ
jgi:hypothetical protein